MLVSEALRSVSNVAHLLRNRLVRILYISDRGKGGIKNHVQCLRRCLPANVVHYTIGEDEPFAGSSGHSFAEWKQIRRVVKTFQPDVIHLHTLPLLMCLYLKLFVRKPRFASLHTPGDRKPPLKERILHWLVKPTYYLPVSGVTWHGFQKWYKGVKGEVFFNPIEMPKAQLTVSGLQLAVGAEAQNSKLKTQNPVAEPQNSKLQTPNCNLIAGLIGRWADQKDWPSFAKVTSFVAQKLPSVAFWGVGVSQGEAENRLGNLSHHIAWKGFQANGREWIGKMDLFILTSKHEELPTVVLEAFLMKTAICGYIPRGGMTDILAFSNGALKSVFIEERDPQKLATIVQRLLEDEDLRQRVVEDGWQIVTKHFDARKNCKHLVEIYRRQM